jgi:hypothetical protein
MSVARELRCCLRADYGGGELTSYHRNLLRAVEVWRNRGVWRVPLDESRNKPPYCDYRPLYLTTKPLTFSHLGAS